MMCSHFARDEIVNLLHLFARNSLVGGNNSSFSIILNSFNAVNLLPSLKSNKLIISLKMEGGSLSKMKNSDIFLSLQNFPLCLRNGKVVVHLVPPQHIRMTVGEFFYQVSSKD